jgi:hypothetical protein
MIQLLPSTLVVPDTRGTIHGASYGAFKREILVSSFAAIRDFLRNRTIVTKE